MGRAGQSSEQGQPKVESGHPGPEILSKRPVCGVKHMNCWCVNVGGRLLLGPEGKVDTRCGEA